MSHSSITCSLSLSTISARHCPPLLLSPLRLLPLLQQCSFRRFLSPRFLPAISLLSYSLFSPLSSLRLLPLFRRKLPSAVRIPTVQAPASLLEFSCGKHGYKRKKVYRYILYGLLAFLLVVLLTILIVYLVLRPAKPSFTLQDAIIYQFNLTSPNTLTTIPQITLYSTNPNNHIGIYYDSLFAYASYAYQHVTLRIALPPIHVITNVVTSWSLFLYDSSVPVGPYVIVELGQDQAVGAFIITVHVDGKVRWRVGSWVLGRYSLDVNCQAYVLYVGAWKRAERRESRRGGQWRGEIAARESNGSYTAEGVGEDGEESGEERVGEEGNGELKLQREKERVIDGCDIREG